VSRSVWYDAKTGDFLDLQGNVLREAVQDGKPLYDSVRYYGGVLYAEQRRIACRASWI